MTALRVGYGTWGKSSLKTAIFIVVIVVIVDIVDIVVIVALSSIMILPQVWTQISSLIDRDDPPFIPGRALLFFP
jgi:hypothetical protein